MSYRDNVYHYPENHGLKTIGEIDWSSGCYEFDLTVVWHDQDGQLYYAEDSGCSCPGTFDGYERVEDLTKCTFFELAEHLKKRYHEDSEYATETEIVDLLGRVRQLAVKR